MAEIKEMPKIALGAWAWGNDGHFEEILHRRLFGRYSMRR